MKKQGRILTDNWDMYDTRHVVYKTQNISAEDLEAGYRWAYKEFYSWSNIIDASTNHDSLKHMIKHFLYAGGWKKFEPLWNFAIKSKNVTPARSDTVQSITKEKQKSYQAFDRATGS
jgi:hypothetical protein